MSPASPPVDFLPILKYVPERWASWKTLCRNIRTLQREVYFGLLNDAEERLQTASGNGCFIEDIIVHQRELGMSREMIGYVSV